MAEGVNCFKAINLPREAISLPREQHLLSIWTEKKQFLKLFLPYSEEYFFLVNRIKIHIFKKRIQI